MFLRDKTLTELGYEEPSAGSNKLIWAKCDYCNSDFTVTNKNRVNSNKFLNKDCCVKCKYKKRDECCILKYGVTNPGGLPETRIKIKATTLKNHGVEMFLNTPEFIEKSNKTKMDRYGTTNVMSVKEISDRQKKSVMDKYGVENVSQLPETRIKVQETCIYKYGTKEFLSSDYAIDKRTDTNVEKYGVPNQFQRDEIKEISKQTRLDKYGFEYAMQNPDTYKKAYETMVRAGRYKKYGGKSLDDLAIEKGFARTTFFNLVKKHSLDEALLMVPNVNQLELAMKTFLDAQNIEYKQHAVVNGRKTDFLLNSGKIIIETDGLYWHSDRILRNDYHVQKRKDYLKAGYRTMFFREHEVYTKMPIVQSIILNALNKSDKIGARECTMQKVDKIISKKFLIDNHLMGSGRGDCYGLYHNNELITVLQIRRIKDNKYEVARFCHKLHMNVMGGFSKLLKFAEDELKPSYMVTFVDLRYGTGDYLESLGFARAATHKSFKWTNGTKVFNRMQFPGKTGYDAGLAKIWDCGQAKFIKTY